MYNRYIRNDGGRYERVTVPDESPFSGPPPGDTYDMPPQGGEPFGPPPPPPQPPPPGGGRQGFLSGILERLNLKNLDTGDLLLLLIIFLLYKEGGDEELLIALVLLLIL